MKRDQAWALLIGLLAISVFFSVFQRDLFVGDETKYGEVIRSMRSEGSIFVPVLDGKPYSHKPPLHFWAVYALAIPMGTHSLWPFVIPALAAFLALLLVVRWIGRELFDAETGWVAAFAVGTFYLIWGLAQTARMDLEFTVLLTIAILFLLRFLERGKPGDLTLCGALVGLTIMVKGPMAFVIVLFILIFEALRRRAWPRGNYFPAFLLAAGIPLLWLIPAVIRGGREYADELLIKQNVGRALNAWTHKEPFWYYVAHAPLTFFPWFFLAVLALAAMWKRPSEGVERERLRFCVSWILAVVVPFSLISSKLDVYMVPAAVPLALLVAHFVTRSAEDRLTRLGIAGTQVLTVLLGAVGAAVLAGSGAIMQRLPDAALLAEPRAKLLFAGMALTALAALVVQARARERRLLTAAVTFGVVAIFPLVYAGSVLMADLNQFGSTEPLVRKLGALPARGSEIGLYSSPHLWSRNMPPSLEGVRYLDARAFRDGAETPSVVAARSDRAPDLGTRLLTEYVKIDETRMLGKRFDIYRKR